MCVVSMVMDYYGDKWQKYTPLQPSIYYPVTVPQQPVYVPVPQITPEELAEFHELLRRAREYDKKNNEPDCELESKKERIRKLAEELGVTVNIE